MLMIFGFFHIHIHALYIIHYDNCIPIWLSVHNITVQRLYSFSEKQSQLFVFTTNFGGKISPHPPEPPKSRVIHSTAKRTKWPITAPCAKLQRNVYLRLQDGVDHIITSCSLRLIHKKIYSDMTKKDGKNDGTKIFRETQECIL